MGPFSSNPVLYYDGDCGFCTKVAQLALRARLRIDIAPLQSVDHVSLGLDGDRSQREVPLRYADGRVVYGYRAIASALATGGAVCRFVAVAMTCKTMATLSEHSYHWVAAHRHQLPGGSSTCTLESSH